MRTKLRAESKHELRLSEGSQFCHVAAAMVGAAVVGGVASNAAAKKGAKAMDRATDQNAYQGEIAKDQYEDYKENYRPLEHQLVKEAQDADSEAAQEKAASAAAATVSSQIGLAKERLARTPGLDPSSAAAAAAASDLALKGAAMGANAQNTARQQTKDMAYAKKIDAVSLGKGLSASAGAGLASASAGANALAASQQSLAGQQAAGIGQMTSGLINAFGRMGQTSPGLSMPKADYTNTFTTTDTGLPSSPTGMGSGAPDVGYA
jgi:hypothetical protein